MATSTYHPRQIENPRYQDANLAKILQDFSITDASNAGERPRADKGNLHHRTQNDFMHWHLLRQV